MNLLLALAEWQTAVVDEIHIQSNDGDIAFDQVDLTLFSHDFVLTAEELPSVNFLLVGFGQVELANAGNVVLVSAYWRATTVLLREQKCASCGAGVPTFQAPIGVAVPILPTVNAPAAVVGSNLLELKVRNPAAPGNSLKANYGGAAFIKLLGQPAARTTTTVP